MGKGDFPRKTRPCNQVVGEWMREKGKNEMFTVQPLSTLLTKNPGHGQMKG